MVIDLALGQQPGPKRGNEYVTDELLFIHKGKKGENEHFKRYVQIYKARVGAMFLSGFKTSSPRVAFISARTSNRSAEESAI